VGSARNANRVRTKRPHPICCERESRGVRPAGRPARAAQLCFAPALLGRSVSVGLASAGLASAGLASVAAVCQVCPAALTADSAASVCFPQARLADLASADSNQADSTQVGSTPAAVVCPVALTADPAAPVCFPQARLADLASADSNQADSNQVGSNRAAVCPVALTADSAAPVCFRRGRLADLAWADSNQAAAVCRVGPRVDPGGLACFRLASSAAGLASADSAGLVSPACPAFPDPVSVFPD